MGAALERAAFFMDMHAETQSKQKSFESQSTLPSDLKGFAIQDWGLIDYSAALQRQMDLAGLVHQELARETLVFCSHPPVVTLGRGTLEGDVCGWTGETLKINRGGRATYHGPSQIVVYPILDLNLRGRDVHRFMRLLEEAVVQTLADFGVAASGKVIDSQSEASAPSATGVWCGSRKIASIGIGVRNWVSLHGLALNVEYDPKAFQGLKPCGFAAETMISLEEILAHRPDREAVNATLALRLADLLKL
jgi:lipoate-protein ligase B